MVLSNYPPFIHRTLSKTNSQKAPETSNGWKMKLPVGGNFGPLFFRCKVVLFAWRFGGDFFMESPKFSSEVILQNFDLSGWFHFHRTSSPWSTHPYFQTSGWIPKMMGRMEKVAPFLVCMLNIWGYPNFDLEKWSNLTRYPESSSQIPKLRISSFLLRYNYEKNHYT